MNGAAPLPARLPEGFCLGWRMLVILACGALQVALGGARPGKPQSGWTPRRCGSGQ
jgi:hypothetical protein